MAPVILYHSVLGLRPIELALAEALRSSGHEVWTPDLYQGRAAETIEHGMELKDEIGWDRLCGRAMDALGGLPESTVLVGISMGCGVAASVWPSRPKTKGILLLHALADIPRRMDCQGLPLQVHIGEDDDFWSKAQILQWGAEAEQAKIAAELFTYPGARHFFTDPSLSDYEPSAAGRTLERILLFLARV
jgi:dienelactone hydrolase